jgi:hypothetical protein
MFTAEELARMTDAEKTVAKAMNADEEAGKDPLDGPDAEPEASALLDEERTQEPAAEAPAPAPAAEGEQAPAEAAAAPAEAPAAAPAPAADASTTPVEDQPAPDTSLRLEGKEPEKYDEQRAELRKQKSEARKKWSAGEIDDSAYEAVENEVDDKLEVLREQHLTAKALNEANAQFRQQQENTYLQQLIVRAKAEGIDYADTKIAARYDRALGILSNDPDYAGKPFAELAEEAHRTVLAMHGKGASAAPVTAPAPRAAAAPRVAPPVPKTLTDLPQAATTLTGDTTKERLAAAQGRDAEKLWNALPESKKLELLNES